MAGDVPGMDCPSKSIKGGSWLKIRSVNRPSFWFLQCQRAWSRRMFHMQKIKTNERGAASVCAALKNQDRPHTGHSG
jgi:hypothetical protein